MTDTPSFPSGPRLTHPSELSPARHGLLLAAFRDNLARCSSSGLLEKTPEDELPAGLPSGSTGALRIRDWSFELEDGVAVAELVIDWQDLPPTLRGPEDPQVPLGACLRVHRALMEAGALDVFGDDVEVRVGSPGIEGPLRDLSDFQANVPAAAPVRLESWAPGAGPAPSFQGRLVAVRPPSEPGDTPKIVLDSGAGVIELPWSEIRRATLLLAPSPGRGLETRAGRKKK